MTPERFVGIVHQDAVRRAGATMPAPSDTTRAQRRPPLAIRGVTIVDVRDGTLVTDQTVLVEGDRIRAVGPAGEVVVPAGAVRVEAGGRFLIPGLWDMHTHTLTRWRWAFPLHVANGVTGIRDLATAVPLAELRRIRADVAAGTVTGPRFVAAGPLIDGPGSSREYLSVRTPAEARAAVDSLHAEGADFIKVYDLLPRDAFHAVMAAAKRHGLPVAGHIPEALDDPTEAFAAGLRSMEHIGQLHFFCGTAGPEIMRLVRQGDSAMVRGDTAGAGEIFERAGRLRFTSYDPARCEAVGRAMAARGAWFTPTLTLELQTLMPPVDLPADSVFANPQYRYMPGSIVDGWRRRHAAAVADTNPEERREALERKRQSLAKLGDVHRGGAAILAGTDGSGSFQVFGFNLHDELGWLVHAGLTPLEALQAATLEPARFLGRMADHGTVEPGKRADLVLLDANPLLDIANTRRIHAVVLDGRLLRRAELDSLLAGVADFHRRD
jgi:imidazolonepropionase-like amidohydrolase